MGASKKEFEQLKEKEMSNEMLWDTHEVPKEIKPIELSGDVAPEIFGIEPVKAQEMVSGLSTIFSEREILKNAYLDVIELEINSENLPIFKELRLKIVKNRTQGIEKWHKINKAFYLAGGRFVDAIKNKEILENLQMEEKLMEGEKYFENIEKEKARLLNLERIEKIRPYVENADDMSFSEFDDESFDDFVFGKKTRFENEKKEREAETLRIENERLAEIEKQKAIQAENERLKKEAEAREKQIAKVRAESEAKIKEEQAKAKAEADKIEAENQAKLKIEREAKAKVEDELKAKKDAELKAENERLAIEEKAKKDAEKLAKAGVEVQLKTWIDTFNIEIPVHLKDNEIANDIVAKFYQFKSWSKKQSEL